MQFQRCFVIVGVATAALVAGAQHATAQLRFEYGVDLSVENLVATDRQVDVNTAPVGLSLDNSPLGSATGTSFVGTGVNKAAATLHLNSTPENPVQIGYANAYSYWYDIVTISDPVLNGTPGTFTASMLVNGAGNVTATGPWVNDPTTDLLGLWQAFIGVFQHDKKGTFEEDGWYGFWEAGPTGQFEYTGAPLGQVQADITFNFVFGQPFTLSGRLQTYMDAFSFDGTPGTFDGDLDLGNSAYWAGLTDISTASGTPVPTATLTSQSGVRWDLAIDPGVLRGDFDANDLVNLDDFNILASSFGGTVTPWTAGDATGNGLVDLDDFNILAGNFGQTVGVGVPTPEDWSALLAAIPEPGSLAVSLVVISMLVPRRARV